ncbi:hypothetical protein AgCh_023526 [Apium graveolens]
MRSLKISVDDKFQSRGISKDDILQECFAVRPSGSGTVLPPLQTNNKGSRKRINSAAELGRDGKKRKLRICKTCNTEGYHDSRKYPTKVSTVEKFFSSECSDCIKPSELELSPRTITGILEKFKTKETENERDDSYSLDLIKLMP